MGGRRMGGWGWRSTVARLGGWKGGLAGERRGEVGAPALRQVSLF